MRTKALSALLKFILLFTISSCSKQSQIVELKMLPLDNLEGVVTQANGVQLDRAVSSDGKGSLKITANGPMVIKLFETSNINLDNARLIYQAKLKTEKMDGEVYLEMLCHFPGRGEFFSRGLQNPMTGTMNWSIQEIPFFLKKGERPDNVKLNLVINGKGTAWIDDVRLLKANL
ncbi:MAG: hypothetical protein RBG1_1C00001G1073 [candidate division Zixibacteria bacterium RBG-1]|nr:MAG: hypothetical protein RBG1_1C00001G1073 [candidate division Zixibacteria bacterium RBG-1]OGC83189.1 MAG: hypothetical protein A2V73_06730 [candidate division Zixibacteria bacterium RBG_19FT_COMBO_42_43]